MDSRSRSHLYRLATFAVAGVALAAAATASDAGDYSRVYHQTLAVKAGETLRVANLAGTIRVVAGKGPDLVVEASIHGAGDLRSVIDGMSFVAAKDRKGRPEWALSYPVDTYDGFSYPTRGGESSGWFDNSRSTLEYMGRRISVYSRVHSGAPVLYADIRLELPVTGAIVMRNGAGAVRGERLTGDFGIDTGSGDVEISAFDGKLEVDTGSGDVNLGELKGALKVDTGSGDVRVTSLNGDGTVETGSGDIDLKAVVAKSFSADTGSGNVRVASGSVATLVADTGSGDIRIEGVEVETFKGDTGSGDVTLKSTLANARDIVVDTGSGSVRIFAGANASFDLEADQGSGDLVVDYADAVYKKHGREIYGARRGDGKTRIRVDTGSGDCVIKPEA